MISPRSVLAAGALWVGLHLLMLVRNLDSTSRPGLSVLAGVSLVAASALALRPLLGYPVALDRRTVALLAAAPVLVASAVTPFLSQTGYVGFGNWWPGAVGPLLAALVLRRRALLAAAAAAGCVIVLLVFAPAAIPGSELAGHVLAQSVPLALWPLAALAVRGAFDRASSTIAALNRSSRRAQDSTERFTAVDMATHAAIAEAVPLLRSIAAGTVPRADDVLEAHRLERVIRDELRAGRLLTPAVRAWVAHQRDLGWHVTLDDHASPERATDPADDQLRHDILLALADVVREVPAAQPPQLASPSRLELLVPADDATLLTISARAHQHVLDRCATAAKHVLTLRTSYQPQPADDLWLDVDYYDEGNSVGALWIAVCRRDVVR